MVASSGTSSAPLNELLRVVPRWVDRTTRQVELSRVLLGHIPCVGERMMAIGVALRPDQAASRSGRGSDGLRVNGATTGVSTIGTPPVDMVGSNSGDAGSATGQPLDVSGVAATEGRPPTQEDLAIPEYDSLAASQVIPRLEMLKPTDLRQILLYEEGNRNRQTIVHKVGQLLLNATNQ